jgi:hypothetical protein
MFKKSNTFPKSCIVFEPCLLEEGFFEKGVRITSLEAYHCTYQVVYGFKYVESSFVPTQSLQSNEILGLSPLWINKASHF